MLIKTQNGLNIDQTKKTVTGKKNVWIKHQENILTADTVILYYTDDRNDRIQKIKAIGHVVLDNGKNKITGDEGEYNPKTEDVDMLGNIKLYQGKSFVTGEKATLNMASGKSQLFNQKPQGRVKGRLSPDDFKN